MCGQTAHPEIYQELFVLAEYLPQVALKLDCTSTDEEPDLLSVSDVMHTDHKSCPKLVIEILVYFLLYCTYTVNIVIVYHIAILLVKIYATAFC